MRDLAVFILVLGSLPIILMRPYVGVLVWSWLAYMNPHRLTWSWAYDFPFSQVVAIVLLISVAFSKVPKRIPWNSTTIVWSVFFLWTLITTLVALNPSRAAVEWDRWWKIQLISVIALVLMRDRQRLSLLVWVIVLSLGFYGVKGGIFAIATGGEYQVLGPALSFIAGNTAIGLALIMTLPLMRYLQLEAPRRWVRVGLGVGMVLTTLAIIATHSRGALLGIVAMGGYLLLKSPKKLGIGVAIALLVAIVLVFMPEHWADRMVTIRDYEEDVSAMGRINAWWFAFNLALDRPLVGGGFRVFSPDLFARYAPNPEDFHDAHSIYFEVLRPSQFRSILSAFNDPCSRAQRQNSQHEEYG